MLTTAEVQVPQRMSQPVDARHFLYEAFCALSDVSTIKDYPRWKKHNNKTWIGGVTAAGNKEALPDIPFSVVLREAPEKVQLMVVNRDAWAMDRSPNYQKDGWEFSPKNPDVLLFAEHKPKGRNQDKVIVRFRTDNESKWTIADKDGGSITEDLKEYPHLLPAIVFGEFVNLLEKISIQDYPAREVLTSPIWRDYTFGRDSKGLSQERVLGSTVPNELLKHRYYGKH